MKFLVHVRDFSGIKLFAKDRHTDDVKLHIKFDQVSFETPFDFVDNDGGARWSFERSFVYDAPDDESEKYLEQRSLTISCYHDVSGYFGTCSVDLYTVATGPLEHDLPLKNAEKEVGRLSFAVSMEQFSMVRAHFLFFRVNHLQPLLGHSHVRPYLRYGYHEAWKNHHQFKESSVKGDVGSPEWTDLEDLEFLTSIPRLLSSSLEVHICHRGSLADDRYAKLNITFAKSAPKLMEPGHVFEFTGKLKYHDASVDGKLVLSNLPKYVQMVPHSRIQKPLQTETGIHNADMIAPGFEEPHLPIFVVDMESDSLQHVNFEVPQIDSEIWKQLDGHSSPHNSNSNHEHGLGGLLKRAQSSGYEQL